MEYSDYLREEAAKYRALAEDISNPAVAQEFRNLADTCEQVAAEIEDRLPAG